MENDEKMMTGEESLRIITEMINKTKVSIRQGSFHLLFWGWLLIVCSLTAWLLGKYSSYAHPYYAWFLIIPGAFVSMIYGFVNGRKEKVRTYANMLYMWTWIGFIIAATVLFIIQAKSMQTVTPYILLLAGFPTFLSGFIIRFKPLIFGGICFWIIALLVNFASPDLAPLGTPVAMLIGYLIPGYMLKTELTMTRFNELDPILHSQLRLAVISLLISAEAAEFTYIREQTGATAGNLSTQITKLKEAGYIEVTKSFRNNYPQTLCSITSLGKHKFSEYVNSLKDYLNPE